LTSQGVDLPVPYRVGNGKNICKMLGVLKGEKEIRVDLKW
jgi:hypothetical protein